MIDVEKYEITPQLTYVVSDLSTWSHNKCGEILNFLLWLIVWSFCRKIWLFMIHVIMSQNLFCQDVLLLPGEHWTKKLCLWRKIKNMMFAPELELMHYMWNCWDKMLVCRMVKRIVPEMPLRGLFNLIASLQTDNGTTASVKSYFFSAITSLVDHFLSINAVIWILPSAQYLIGDLVICISSFKSIIFPNSETAALSGSIKQACPIAVT